MENYETTLYIMTLNGNKRKENKENNKIKKKKEKNTKIREKRRKYKFLIFIFRDYVSGSYPILSYPINYYLFV